jgi:type IV secretion system protein VirD4
MPQDQLIVLRAGLPPIRGRKIVYWRERAFARRVQPPPRVAARPLPGPEVPAAAQTTAEAKDPFDLTLDLAMPALAAEGIAPLPVHGASAADVEAWVDRFIDLSAQSREVAAHGR